MCYCRYKLAMMVDDGTSMLPLMLWDKEGSQIIGKSAQQLDELYEKVDLLSLPSVMLY